MAALTGYKAVAVVIESGKRYHFAIYEDENNYEVGDHVIATYNDYYYVTKKIDEIVTPEESKAEFSGNITSEIIGKANEYVKRVEKRKEAAAIKKKMNALAKKIDAERKYEFYASENEEFRKMYETYKEMSE